MKIAFSVNGVPIRLTQERVEHIHKNHTEMKGEEDKIPEVVNNPDLVQQGDAGSLLAVKKFDNTPVTKNKYLTVAYKEHSPTDGFVLTSYYSSNLRNRKILWKN